METTIYNVGLGVSREEGNVLYRGCMGIVLPASLLTTSGGNYVSTKERQWKP